MAWFHFCTANHNEVGRSTLVDMADWFHAGLTELGHKVTFSETHVERSAINLFWEYFEPGMAEELLRAGIEYGIIATELPDGRGFNWQESEIWRSRFNCFAQVASRAKFIWTMIESSIPFYAQFCPTAFIELGFSERLIPVGMDIEPRIDFCFFGLKTPYRVQVVKEIEKYANVVWPEGLLSPAGVEELICNSRVGLNFKQSERWPIPSPTRLGRLMMAQRAVAAECVPVVTRQGLIAGVCPENIPFHEYALHILREGWRKKAESVFERYRAEMPMALIMEQVLDYTISRDARGLESESVEIRFYPPVLVAEDERWNYFLCNGEYFSLRKSLGAIDIRLGGAVLQELYGEENVLCARTLSDLSRQSKK